MPSTSLHLDQPTTWGLWPGSTFYLQGPSLGFAFQPFAWQVVIFGKCSDFVLEDFPKLSVFIYASKDFKEERILNTYKVKKDKLEIKMTRENNRRANHYSRNTGRTWGESANYDILINSSSFDFESIADQIINLAQNKK